MIFDILFIICVLIILYANVMLRSYNKKLNTETKMSGFEVAKLISDKYAKNEPHIIKKDGRYLDYYDKERNVIKLSPEVFDNNDEYANIIGLFMALRTIKEYDAINNGYKLRDFMIMGSYLVIIIGSFLTSEILVSLGIIMFVLSIILNIILINNISNKIKDSDLDESIKANDLNIDINESLKVLISKDLSTIFYSFINLFR